MVSIKEEGDDDHDDYELQLQFAKLQSKAQLHMLNELESQVRSKQSEVAELNEEIELKKKLAAKFSKHRFDFKHLESK